MLANQKAWMISRHYAEVGRKMLGKDNEFYFPENLFTHCGFNKNTPFQARQKKKKKCLKSEKTELVIVFSSLFKMLQSLDLCIN